MSLVKISDEMFASGLLNGFINIWNFKTGSLFKKFKAHNGSVDSLAYLSDGNLASTSKDKSIKIWNPVSTQLIKTLPNAHSHKSDLVKMKIIDDESVAVTSDNEIKIWNFTSSELIRTLTSDGRINCLLLLKNHSMIASGSADYKIRLWNVNDGKLLITLDACYPVWCLEVLPSGYLIAGLNDGSFKIFNHRIGLLIKAVKHHSNAISSFLILKNKYFISSSADKTIKIFES